MIDFYEILEVNPKASQEIVRAAYAVLMERYAPEKNPNASETARMRADIQLAYDVLSNPEQRKGYDAELNKAKNRSIESSQNPNLYDPASKNPSKISRLKTGQTQDVTGASDGSSLLSRLKWKQWGWAVSILAVVAILISMVQPDPEKAERGHLAVKLEAERDRQKLEAELLKKTAQEQKTDATDNQRKASETINANSNGTNTVDSAP